MGSAGSTRLVFGSRTIAPDEFFPLVALCYVRLVGINSFTPPSLPPRNVAEPAARSLLDCLLIYEHARPSYGSSALL